MEISPYRLFLLLVYSFLFGISAGVFNDINRIVRALLGNRYSGKNIDRLYDISLPFIGKLSRSEADKKLKRRLMSLLIFLQDIALFFYLGCGVVILNYYMNRGQFRLYTIAACLFGALLYYFTIGKLVIFLSEGVVFFIRAVFGILIYLISRPFVWMFCAVRKILLGVCKKIYEAIAKRSILRYNKKRVAELEKLSESGFIETDRYFGEG